MNAEGTRTAQRCQGLVGGFKSKYAVSEEPLDTRMNVKLSVILFAHISLQFYFKLRI